MAFVGPESTCAVCGQLLGWPRDFFATSGVFLPLPLGAFCDAPIHWECYTAWPHRREFAEAYFRTLIYRVRVNPYWSLVHVSERVAVAVNPGPPVQEVEVVLADVGYAVRVPLTAWQSWCAGLPASCAAHATVVRKAIGAVTVELKQQLPSVESVLNRVDWDAKAQLLAEQRERERQRDDARRQELAKHQAKWRDRARAGPVCPYCRANENIRPMDLSPERQSYFICGNCGRSFDGT